MKKVYIVFSDFTDIGFKEVVAVYSEQVNAEAHVKQLYAELEEDTSLLTYEKVCTKYYFQTWEVK